MEAIKGASISVLVITYFTFAISISSKSVENPYRTRGHAGLLPSLGVLIRVNTNSIAGVLEVQRSDLDLSLVHWKFYAKL